MTSPAASDSDSEPGPDRRDSLAAAPGLAQPGAVLPASPPVDAKHPTPAAFLPPGPWMPNPFYPVRHLMLESTEDVRKAIKEARRRR